MVLKIGNFLGPRIVDEDAYGNGNGLVTSGRLLGNFPTGIEVQGAVNAPLADDSSVFWWCAEEIAVDDDGGATGDEDRLIDLNTLSSGRLQLFAVRQASGDFVVRLKDDGTTLATGTTEYSYHPTFHTCRITMTGSQWGVEFGGSLEINVENSGVPTGIGAQPFLDRLQHHLKLSNHHETCFKMIELQNEYWPNAKRKFLTIDIEYLSCENRKYFSYLNGTKSFDGKNLYTPLKDKR